MNLVDLFPESRLLLELRARDKKSAIREMVQFMVESGAVADEAGKKIEKAVAKREAQGSTAIGKGLAIPHAKECPFLAETVAVFARSREGIEFSSIDGGLVHLVFLVVSPPRDSDKHLAALRKIAALHRDEKTLKFLTTTNRVISILEILKEIDETVR